MRLGELLVRAGFITADQLEVGLATSRSEGARLGSTLIKLGFLDADTLARALGKQQAVTPVSEQELGRINGQVIGLISAELAHRHGVVPVRMTAPGKPNNRLLVAMIDPSSLSALDEIAFAAEQTIQPGTASKELIQRHLQRLYPQPQARHVKMIDLEASTAAPTPAVAYRWLRDTRAVLEVHGDGCVLLVDADEWRQLMQRRKEVLELVNEYVGRIHDATRQLTVRARRDRELISHFARRGLARQEIATHTPPGKVEGAVDQKFFPTLQRWTESLFGSGVMPDQPQARDPSSTSGIRVVTGDVEPQAPPRSTSPAPRPAPPLRPSSGIEVEPVFLLTKRKETPEEVIEELCDVVEEEELMPSEADALATTGRLDAPTLKETLAAIEAAEDTDGVAHRILAFLLSRVGTALILMVKEEMLLGWKGYSPSVDGDAIESVMIPRSVPSVLNEVVERKEIIRAPVVDEPIMARLLKLLHLEAPLELAAAPIHLKERVVNLVCVFPVQGEKLPRDIGVSLSDLTQAASERYVALIRKRKSSKT